MIPWAEDYELRNRPGQLHPMRFSLLDKHGETVLLIAPEHGCGHTPPRFFKELIDLRSANPRCFQLLVGLLEQVRQSYRILFDFRVGQVRR